MAIPSHGSITYSSYHWQRPASITLPGGSTRQYSYDPLMRLKTITIQDPGLKVLMEYQYAYDLVDNIVQKATEHGDYGYSYDELSRLTGTEQPALEDKAYTYDKVGNRLTASDVIGQYVYNENNELLAVDATTIYAHDVNGNRTGKSVSGAVTEQYVYDVDNQLTQVKDGQGATLASNAYDPFGRATVFEVKNLLFPNVGDSIFSLIS